MPEKQKARYIHIVLDKANRLEKLINEFFEITRYYLQQIILEKETFDLYYLLVQLTDEFYPVLTAHGNTIRLLADENSRLYGDPGKLARVFNNNLKNAVYYSYPDTPIEIMTEYLPDQVAILFRNRGKTIPPQKLQSILKNSSVWMTPVPPTPAAQARDFPSRGKSSHCMAGRLRQTVRRS